MKEKKPTVFFLPAWYPNRGNILDGLFVQFHARAVQQYANVGVLFVWGENRELGPVVETEITDLEGIPEVKMYYRKSTLPLVRRLVDAYLYLACTLKGYALLTRLTGPADIHHVHILTRAGIIAWLLNITSRIPYIITEHWTRYLPQNISSYQGQLRRWLTQQIVRRAHAVCPVNEDLAKAMQQQGLKNDHYVVVNNVVDTARFFPVSGTSREKKVLLHVSCFIENQKNTHGLLRAIQALKKERNDFMLHLVGTGDDWKKSQEYCRELGLTAPDVVFCGMLTGQELVQQYQQADALVLFSNFENQPVVILEAFACGIPAIGTDVGGVHELLADNRGILVPQADEIALVNALRDFLDGKKLAGSMELRAYAEDHFGYTGVGKQFFNLYLSALNK